VHRTAKQLIDSGRAADPAEAEAILEDMVLQVDVGPSIERDAAGQAALLTIVNAAQRAFLGGVRIRVEDDPILTAGWGTGLLLSNAIARFGGQVEDVHTNDHPTLVVGAPSRETVGRIVMQVTWQRWSGGVVEIGAGHLGDDGIALAGVVAGALGVSEAFQHCLGSAVAGRRDVGISLWRPDLDWRQADAAGPILRWLPRSLWLLGLGHLGQGYAWSLGWLPYSTDSGAIAYLMDFDSIIRANLATGLLAFPGDINKRKTRVVAELMESRGFRTFVVERPFDATLQPGGDEPGLALAGFDDPAPRLLLGGNRFGRVVDVGLGAGHVEYLDIVLHTFPSQLVPEVEFAGQRAAFRPLPAAYEAEVDRRIAAGVEPGAARCGMSEFAGIAVGAAFVGAVAASLALADPLRSLHEGRGYAVVSVDLRSPDHVQTAFNEEPGAYIPPAIEVSV
jgi:hypothetical protein